MKRERTAGRYQIDMCSGPILPKLLAFALPLMASNILQLLFAAADSIVVGKFAGEASLAAVGSTVSLINLITNLFLGLSVGSNVAAARAFGLDDEEGLHKTVHTSLSLSLVVGILLTGIGLFGAEAFLRLMKTPDEILPLAALYLRIYFLGMTAMTVYNYGSALLRAVGDTKRPLLFLSVSGLLNILLNLIFVIALKLGVVGVAISTVITQTLSASLILFCLSREEGGIRLVPKKLGFDREKLTQILRVGLPAGLQASMYSISNVVVQSSINLFGRTVIAANTAAVNLEDMVYFAMNALQQATTAFTGQNAGRRSWERIAAVRNTALLCVIAAGISLSGFFYIAAPRLLRIFSDSPAVLAAGVERLRIVLVLYFVCGIMEVFVGGLRGLGVSATPTVISLIGVCGIRLFWLTVIFNIPALHRVTTVYFVYPITWVITAAAEGIAFSLILRRMKKRFPPAIRQPEVTTP